MALKRKPPEGDVRRVASMGLNLPGVTTNKNGHTVQFESFAERLSLLKNPLSKLINEQEDAPSNQRSTLSQAVRERLMLPPQTS